MTTTGVTDEAYKKLYNARMAGCPYRKPKTFGEHERIG